MSIDSSKIQLPPRVRMDCYRMALYPILKYYNAAGADLLMILSDSQLSYQNKLVCNKIEYIPLTQLLRDLKIVYSFFNSSCKTEILTVVKKALDNDCFLIACLDIFYYSPFYPVYQKLHTVHGIPIYGYDDNKRVFHTIDADYLESFERTFLEISYEDLVNSTIGYCNLKKAPAIQILKSIDPDRLLRGQDIREKYVIEYSESVHTSRRADYQLEMNDFFHYISDFAFSESEMINFSMQSYQYIDQFINDRMLEYYGKPYIFQNIHHLQELDMKIVEKCNYIRAIMYRTIYTREYRKKSFEKFPDYFKSIISLENERLDFISTFQWENNINYYNDTKC